MESFAWLFQVKIAKFPGGYTCIFYGICYILMFGCNALQGITDQKTMKIDKWIVSDIPRGLATGLASEYNEKNSLH
jgi:hypothetical protein